MAYNPNKKITNKDNKTAVSKQSASVKKKKTSPTKQTQGLTFRDFTEKTWFPYEIDNGERKPGTITFNRSMLKMAWEYFGDMELRTITGDDIRAYNKYLRTERKNRKKVGMAPKTIRDQHSTLSMIFASAERRELLDKNPMQYIETPRLQKEPPDALSKEEMQTLLKSLPETKLDFQCLIMVLLTTGFRRGECIGLKWEDIDFDKKTIRIERNVTYSSGNGIVIGTPKTARGKREVPLFQETKYVLLKYREQVQKENPKVDLKTAYIFHGKKDLYSPRDPNSVTKRVKDHMKKIGLSQYSPHDLRHTYGTFLNRTGADPKSIQVLMGHASAATTFDHYVRPDMEQIQKAVDGFAGIIGRSCVDYASGIPQ